MKIKPVMVEWIDSMGSSGWHDHKKSDMGCVTVGLMHKKHKDSVVIALNQSAYGRGDYIEIPKCAIRKITTLKKPRRGK